MIRLSSSPDLSHDQKPPTAIPPDIYEILSLEGSEMKKRNVIVCRVKCAVEGVPSGCLLPSLPPGGSHGTEGSRGQAGTLGQAAIPTLVAMLFTVTDDSWRRVDVCDGADQGWARVIEARGGRPRRKSRGRAIAEAPPS